MRQTHHIVHRNAPIDPTTGTTGCSGDLTIPGCSSPRRPTCDVQMVTGVLRSFTTATSDELTMAPKRTNFFQALSEKMVVIDDANPDLNRRIEVQSVKINDIPQEPFTDALSAANSSAALSDFFGPAFTGYGKPVAYGIYSQESLINVFKYGLWNIEAVDVTVYVAHYGNAIETLPPGLKPGTPFNQG